MGRAIIAIPEIVQALQDKGVEFRVEGDRLSYKPAEAIPNDLKELLKANRDEVIENLRAP